jgi:hypothetical protein
VHLIQWPSVKAYAGAVTDPLLLLLGPIMARLAQALKRPGEERHTIAPVGFHVIAYRCLCHPAFRRAHAAERFLAELLGAQALPCGCLVPGTIRLSFPAALI